MLLTSVGVAPEIPCAFTVFTDRLQLCLGSQ